MGGQLPQLTALHEGWQVHMAVHRNGQFTAHLLTLLPPGCARNALDCALWDLQSRLQQRPIWQLLGLTEREPRLPRL